MLTATDAASSNAAHYLPIRSPLSSSAWSSAASCQGHPGHVLSGLAGDLRGDVAVGVHGQWETQKSRNATAAGETTSYNM